MSDTQPLVSIVTPVFNRASTISVCLASVAGQTYPNVEHIVVDGGSTDGTLDILSSHQSKHLFRYISEQDDGMYDAINKGLALARGTVLAYLNSDDYYPPWAIEVAVDRLLKDSDLIFGDLALIERHDNSLRPKFYLPFDLNYYTHFGALAQPTIFWKASVTKQIGRFDTSYQLLGDCEYWLRAAAAGFTVTRVDEILAIQVEHEGTLRATRPDELEQEHARLGKAYETVAGPPAATKLNSWRRKVKRRLLYLRFARAARKVHPPKWSRFLGFLSEQNLGMNRQEFYWYLLPARFWPRPLSALDAAEFEDRMWSLWERDGQSG